MTVPRFVSKLIPNSDRKQRPIIFQQEDETDDEVAQMVSSLKTETFKRLLTRLIKIFYQKKNSLKVYNQGQLNSHNGFDCNHYKLVFRY
jgi:hypothetical protein